MPWDLTNTDHFARACMLIAAWQAGQLSEGQTCALLDVDAVTLREMLQGALDAASEAWRVHRQKHPPTRAR